MEVASELTRRQFKQLGSENLKFIRFPNTLAVLVDLIRLATIVVTVVVLERSRSGRSSSAAPSSSSSIDIPSLTIRWMRIPNVCVRLV